MAKRTKSKKLFVLDTNVFIYDPSSIFRFKDNDVFISMTTLEELDSNKKGQSDVARNCRQVSRVIDEIVSSKSGTIKDGFDLKVFNGGQATGKLVLQTDSFDDVALPFKIPTFKGDNEILRTVLGLIKTEQWQVILVSKDINLRIKAATMGIEAEDYFNDQVLEDSDFLHTGIYSIEEPDFWEKHSILSSGKNGVQDYYTVKGPLVKKWHSNQLIIDKNYDGKDFVAKVANIENDEATLVVIKDFANSKNNVWGVNSKNQEQSFAFNLLLDPNIDLITISGQAGSGKTIITLAAALDLILNQKKYDEVIFTRITVPLGEDIGFLPGTEEEKMSPWMGALYDNLEVLTKPMENSNDWGKKATADVIGSKIKVKSMSFMRGRTFMNKILVIDEAQNLTPKQIKTLITRAGSGTKVICLGNVAQIDTPYLTEASCGLTYLVDRMKGWERAGHVTLAKVERSPLAEYAASVL